MVPGNLKHLIMTDVPAEDCPWSLSGPQFPPPTAIQQRYCYPKGRAEYSDTKGGALWTMFGNDGKEDYMYRLLHVYYSTKRAGNRGAKPPKRSKPRGVDGPYSPPTKRARRRPHSGTRVATPRRGARNCLPITRLAVPNNIMASPAVTLSTAASMTGSNSICASPGSVETFPSSDFAFGPKASATDYAMSKMMIDTPCPPLGDHMPFSNDQFSSQHVYPVQTELRQSGGLGYPAFTRPGSVHHYGYSYRGMGGPSSSRLQQTMDTDMSMFDDDFGMNDPMNNIERKASDDNLDFPVPGQVSSTVGCMSTMTKTNAHNFSSHLDILHNRVRDMICDAPSGDQGGMVSTFASWAQSVADKPLEQPNIASVFRNSGGAKKTPTVLATKKAKAVSSETTKDA